MNPATSVVKENAAWLFFCEAPGMFWPNSLVTDHSILKKKKEQQSGDYNYDLQMRNELQSCHQCKPV